MSLKQVRCRYILLSCTKIDHEQEIETWVAALAYYDSDNYEAALEEFKNIADTSKILFNCGVIHATLTNHKEAVCIHSFEYQILAHWDWH